MGNGDGKAELIAEVLLDLVLPGPACGGIAAAGVGQNQQALRVGVALTAFTLPPTADGMDGKSRSLVGDADKHRTTVGLELVNAVGEGDARCQGAEVVVVDLGGNALPFHTGILEVAHQFPFLGVDADDGITLPAEKFSQPGDAAELSVASGTRSRGDVLAVAAEREPKLAEQSGDGARTHLDAQSL